ncbi:MAG: hypothetical protein Q4G48_08570 [Bacteroidia bacterium]|nr:hypothetical protein [Bacteroidia bacterium]
MKYKIGDRFNVLVPGFSPTVARIDNIKEKDSKLMYYISFHEEWLFIICRIIPEEVLDEIIENFREKHIA